MARPILLLDAASNLGLKPPEQGSIPGCYKLPWALRDQGLKEMLNARDAGSVVPPRYRAEWLPGTGDRNATAIAAYSVALADRLDSLVGDDSFVIVLGGDCSILVGNMLALRRRGRYGLVFLDAHSDYRHTGNAPAIGAAAGEDLAIVMGLGDDRLTNLQSFAPYVTPNDVHILGVRPGDEYLDELTETGVQVTTSAETRQIGATRAAQDAIKTVTRHTRGFWIHLDLDVVDASEMPAVDCPEPDGLSLAELSTALKELVVAPTCAGMEITIFDPDLDPTGELARKISIYLGEALAELLP